jgi:hypothetical protein
MNLRRDTLVTAAGVASTVDAKGAVTDVYLQTVLPGRQGDETARRALDTAGRARIAPVDSRSPSIDPLVRYPPCSVLKTTLITWLL